MNESIFLEKLIDIYEALPGPVILQNGTKFKAEGHICYSQAIHELLTQLVVECPGVAEYITLNHENGTSTFVEFDAESYLGKQITAITVAFPRRGKKIPEVYFFENEHALVDSHKTLLSQGKSLPNLFYLTSSKYSSLQSKPNSKLLKIRKIIEWFFLFESISSLTRKTENGTELVFIERTGQEKLTKPVHFESIIVPEMLLIDDIPDVGHFSDFESNANDSSLHHEEKKKFLRVAFVETLISIRAKGADKVDSLEIAKSIDDIRNSYYEHLELFMEDFVVSEFKKEIEDAHFSYLEKIESVIGNIQGKLYAIPASFLALGALARSKNLEATMLILIAAGLASLFTFLMIYSQKGRASYISTSLSFIFDKFERNSEEEKNNVGILSEVCHIKKTLDEQIESKKKLILFYSVVSWLPLIAALFVVYYRFPDRINTIVGKLWAYVSNLLTC